jgi:hypothetical protein
MPLPSASRPDAELLALRPAISGQPAAIPTPSNVADFPQEYRLPLATADATEAHRLLTELLSRNARLRATLVGVVTGLFTADELTFYRQHRNELNRRLLDLAQQRVLTSLDEL